MRLFLVAAAVIFLGTSASAGPQYAHGKIRIPGASASEPKLKAFSLSAAVDYIENASTAWTKSKRCIACHTNGSYLAIRPELSKALGPPKKAAREFFIERLKVKQKANPRTLMSGLRPTQTAYIALGLAEWDRHVKGKLSAETAQALRLMLKLQAKDGSWGNLKCWPPHESSSYHGATVAAMALATAPGFVKSLDQEKDAPFIKRMDKLTRFLRTTEPPHDYARVLLLWTATRSKDLLTADRKKALVEMIFKHQRKDGGWAIRTFSTPEKWGSGNRAKKLRAEPEFKNPPSDGHMTGLAVLVLRDAGIPANDPRIQKAISWIKSNQRQSGRWWTRSLNTDGYHFVTYSGSLYAIAALAKCGELKK